MNTENVQNVGASQEAVVAQNNVGVAYLKEMIDKECSSGKTSFATKAKEVACEAWDSIKEFSQEIWEDEEGRKLLKDLGIALAVRLAFRHPLTAGIALGIVGHQVWQEIKTAKESANNN